MNIWSASQICADFSKGTKIYGGINMLRTSGYWFPTGFFSK